MEQWYALYTKPKREYQVASALQERGLETYLPESKVSQANREDQKQPFFPCYLFAKIDFQTTGLSQIQWTPGLRHLVAFGLLPTPIPDRIINLLRSKLDNMRTKETGSAYDFQEGDTVRITGGPFQDMLAVFDGPITSSERVHVLLKILGRASRVQVDANDLEKAVPGEDKTPSKRPRRTRGRGRRINYSH